MSNTKQVKVGYLHKLGSHDNWKKRYFILDSNNELSFYANDQSNEILGRLRIQPKTICEECDGPANIGKHFSIQTSLDNKAWKLCAASEAERMVWMESIRNAARSLMTSDLKSGKRKVDDEPRRQDESPARAKNRHLHANVRKGHGRSRSEDINLNALSEALQAREDESKKKHRKSDRKSSKVSELSTDTSLPNISVNNANVNNPSGANIKMAKSSDDIGPLSLQLNPQDRTDDMISEMGDSSGYSQGAHRTKSANIKIDLKAARRGDAGNKSPRRRMMQSGPLSPTKGLSASLDQADSAVIAPKILEPVAEKPLPLIPESEFEGLIEEFKSCTFSDARKVLISSNRQRLTCQQVAEFYDQIDYAEERMLMLSTFIPRIPDLESFDDVVLENILLDAEKEKAREIFKQHQEAMQKQKQEMLVQQQLAQQQQQSLTAPSTPVKIQVSSESEVVYTPSESESRSARSSQSVDAAKRRKPFQGHRRNISVPLSITSNDSSSNRSGPSMDGPSDILFEDQDYRVDFNMLRRIEGSELDDFIKYLKETPFINKRREGLIKLRRDHLLSCEDLSRILDTLTFGEEKVKAIYLLYDSLIDRDQNIKSVSSKLTFQSEKIRVRELLPIS